jgi:hypothetical protein
MAAKGGDDPDPGWYRNLPQRSPGPLATALMAVGPKRLQAATEGFAALALSRRRMSGYLGGAGLV